MLANYNYANKCKYGELLIWIYSIFAIRGLAFIRIISITFFMTKEDNKTNNNQDFAELLDKDAFQAPKAGDTVAGTVLSASKAEVRLDIDGILTGIVRGQELYEEADEYSNLKPGDEVEATVVEEENENGELELSFKYAGQERAWVNLREAHKDKTSIKVKITGANRGGLVANLGQISGFLPVSQLSPEKYPRVSGGDKGKILEKLKSFVGQEMEVMVVSLSEEGREDKIIFSEKDVWSEKRKSVMEEYKIGTAVEGTISAIADFGVFINFGDGLEGLVHISELAWQRIDNPANLFKVGDKIKAEIIDINGSKIFLSAKKLLKDPWENAAKKYKIGQIAKGVIIKINPFGLFVKLDAEIHGLAHISQLRLAPGQKINDVFKVNDKKEFTVVSVEPKEHRLGLEAKSEKAEDKKAESKKTEKQENNKTEKSSPVKASDDKQKSKKEEEKKDEKKDSGKDEKDKKSKIEKDIKDTPKPAKEKENE